MLISTLSLGLGDLSTQDNDVKEDEDLPLIQDILLAPGLIGDLSSRGYLILIRQENFEGASTR